MNLDSFEMAGMVLGPVLRNILELVWIMGFGTWDVNDVLLVDLRYF